MPHPLENNPGLAPKYREHLREYLAMTPRALPRFPHDCQVCHFLGTLQTTEGPVDLYVCPQSGRPTVIARHGPDGADYQSGDGVTTLATPVGPLVLGFIKP